MTLEKAIMDHNDAKVETLIGKGVELNKPFIPFYEAKRGENVTALQVGIKNWPARFCSTSNNNLDATRQHNAPPSS